MSELKYFAYKSKNENEIDYFNSPGIFIQADLQSNKAIILQKLFDLTDGISRTNRIDFTTTTRFNELGYLDDPSFVEISNYEFEIVAIQFRQFLEEIDIKKTFFSIK